MAYAISPSVNTTLIIELNSEKKISNYSLMTKLLEIQYFPNLMSINYEIKNSKKSHYSPKDFQ
jgi:hypothetical protein